LSCSGSTLLLIVTSTSYADQSCPVQLFARVRPFSVRSSRPNRMQF
jgi:hypothetical protein